MSFTDESKPVIRYINGIYKQPDKTKSFTNTVSHLHSLVFFEITISMLEIFRTVTADRKSVSLILIISLCILWHLKFMLSDSEMIKYDALYHQVYSSTI